MMAMAFSSPEVSSETVAPEGETKAYEDMTPSEKRAYTIAKKKAEAEASTE
ncbi:hypothetical protein [Bacillus pseudomycoides]|uniref:hypothetical protein n=1 Tax=Bacillus pseudomycoides TaxID=64104 RepID=UPI00159BC32C|nr:hypothetical protein [Bacillus pseudomycoides]